MSTPFEPIKPAEIKWIDGLPHASAYNDIYFSSEGGLLEAMHVFVHGNQLIERFKNLDRNHCSRFVIGETGFGTGLNFLLTWSIFERVAPPDARLCFITSEKHPLTLADLKCCLALWPELSEYAQRLFAIYPVLTPGYHCLEWDSGRIRLDLMLGDSVACYQERLLCGDPVLESALRQDAVDAWFLDGFSPAKNPAMWSDALFATLKQLSKPGTTLSTFTAANLVKQGLRQAGFEISKKTGYGRKRDMLVGIFDELTIAQKNTPRLIRRKVPWHVASSKQYKTKRVIVIGAGLAGCCLANALARRGFRVCLLDSQNSVGQGASGNHRAILFPNLSAYEAPLTSLMLASFLYASRFYKQWNVGDFSGILQLLRKNKTDQTQVDLARWLSEYPELGQWVDAQTASTLAGVNVLTEAIFIPLAGWIDSPALCNRLIEHEQIQFYPNTTVLSLEREASREWCVAGHYAETIIVTNGYLANQFGQTAHLSIKSLRGQMSAIETSQDSQCLRIPLCGQGHILPASEDVHAIGATFSGASEAAFCTSEDDLENVTQINRLPAELGLSNRIVSHWAGIRAAAQDHLPLVGPVANPQLFKQQFAVLRRNARQWVASSGDYIDGLYIASGFGARGVTTIPLCVEYLAGLINQEPAHLSQQLVRAISPARFLHRAILRGDCESQ